MLSQAAKREEVANLRDKLGRATSVFLADYRGLTVQSVNELRGRLRAEGDGEYEYRVTKNSLLQRATEDSDLAAMKEYFHGPTAVAISYGDPVGLAKVLVDYAKQNEVFELKGGYLDGKALDTEEIATLATLPGLLELRGMLVGLLQAPATKLVRLLVEPGSQLARLVEARRGALAEAGEE